MLSRPQVCSQSNAAGDTSKVAQDGLFLKKGMILPFTPLSMSFHSTTVVEGAESSLITDYTRKTVVLDEIRQEISGGQKKRATTGFSSTFWRTFFAHLVSAGRFYPSKRSNYWLVVMVIMSYGSNPLTKHHAVLGMFNVDPEKYRYWIRVGALLGFIILFNVLITFSLVYT
ncbi:hypothetical protein ACOSQ2_020701 [Xanthoceras sorbifolium]